jgi:hypothetical protein
MKDSSRAAGTPIYDFVFHNATVTLPIEQSAMHGDTTTSATLNFPAYTDADRERIFGPDPTNSIEAATPRSAVVVQLEFDASCFSGSIPPLSAPLTVVLLPPPRSPMKSKEQAEAVAVVVGTVVGSAGAFFSSASIASQLGRTTFTLGLLSCEPDPDTDIVQDPFQMSIDSTVWGRYAGTALFNPIFLVAIAAVLVSVAYGISVIDDRPILEAFRYVRFPSMLAFFILLQTDITIQASMVSIVFGQAYHVAIGIIVLCVVAALVVFATYHLYYAFGGTCVRNAEALTGWRRKVFGVHRWFDTAGLPAVVRFSAMKARVAELRANFVLRHLCAGSIRSFELIEAEVAAGDDRIDAVLSANADAGGISQSDFDTFLLSADDGAAAKKNAEISVSESAESSEALTMGTAVAKETESARHERRCAAAMPTPTSHLGFCLRCKMFYDEYNDRVPHFYVVELAVTCMTGILDGIKLGSGRCAFIGLTYFVMLLLYLGVTLAIMPHLSPLNFAFSISITLIQLTAALLFMIGWWTRNATLYDLSALLVEIGLYLIILKFIADCIKFFTYVIVQRLANELKELEPEEPIPILEAPPPPPTPPPPTPPPEPIAEDPLPQLEPSSEDDEPPPPPPPPKPRRREIDGLQLMVDESLRRALPSEERRKLDFDVLNEFLAANSVDDAKKVLDLADL